MTLLRIDTRHDGAGNRRGGAATGKREQELSGHDGASARPDQLSYPLRWRVRKDWPGTGPAGRIRSARRRAATWAGRISSGSAISRPYTPTDRWNSRSPHDRLRVPIGTTATDAPLELDIKEAAEKGHGAARALHRGDRIG